MIEVRDGNRALRFNGEKLAFSSSRREDSVRWIEFTLFRTEGNKYVLYRVGVSTVFHCAVCPLVTRYGLHEDSPFNLLPNAAPCDECNPTLSEPLVYPEQFRHWTLVSDDAEAVVDALYKTGDHGERYLTKVARKILDDASANDVDIDQAYRVEFIR